LSHPLRENLAVREEAAVLVGVDLPERPIDEFPEPLSELRGLAKTAGARVSGLITQRRQKPDQTTYIGKGKLEELNQTIASGEADVIIFDNELEPNQLAAIEKQTKTKVVDRTELILDIFAARATSSEARLQVELAQLEYLRPRLKRLWTHLERHGGGIGTRGPGETQLETDRRLIDRKIRDLKDRLAVVQQRRSREVEARRELPRVSLVGYTNAGKSTLMQRVTGADVLVADKLFSTLETRTRQWQVPSLGKVLLSDTVGFIRNLPHDLVASFRATLEEAIHATLLLHVVDASNPQAAQHVEAVNDVLEQIGVRNAPTILVLNQCDRVADPAALAALESLHPNTVRVSARTGEGIADLERLATELLAEHFIDAEIHCPVGNGRLPAWLAANGRVLAKSYDEAEVTLTVRLPKPLLGRISPAEARVSVRPVDPEASVTAPFADGTVVGGLEEGPSRVGKEAAELHAVPGKDHQAVLSEL
jgi:GTP-binding protein HflX